MKYALAFYDPRNPADGFEFVEGTMPKSLARLRRIVRFYRQMALTDPEVTLALGIFPVEGRKPKRRASVASNRQAAKRHRLAIFDLCDESVPLDFVGKVLGNSPRDRAYAREAIHEYNEWVAGQPGCSYAMSLFEVG